MRPVTLMHCVPTAVREFDARRGGGREFDALRGGVREFDALRAYGHPRV